MVTGKALLFGDCNMERPRTSTSSHISMLCELGVGLRVMKKIPVCFIPYWCAAEREKVVSAVWSHATVLMANARRGEKVCRGCHRARIIYRINDAGLAGTPLRLHFAARTMPNKSTTISQEKVH